MEQEELRAPVHHSITPLLQYSKNIFNEQVLAPTQ
jgi:hypothetical protein